MRLFSFVLCSFILWILFVNLITTEATLTREKYKRHNIYERRLESRKVRAALANGRIPPGGLRSFHQQANAFAKRIHNLDFPKDLNRRSVSHPKHPISIIERNSFLSKLVTHSKNRAGRSINNDNNNESDFNIYDFFNAEGKMDVALLLYNLKIMAEEKNMPLKDFYLSMTKNDEEGEDVDNGDKEEEIN